MNLGLKNTETQPVEEIYENNNNNKNLYNKNSVCCTKDWDFKYRRGKQLEHFNVGFMTPESF